MQKKVSFSQKSIVQKCWNLEMLKSWSPGVVWGNDVGVNVFVGKSRDKNLKVVYEIIAYTFYYTLSQCSDWNVL